MVLKPYQPVFMRLIDRIGDEACAGVAADCDGALYVGEIFTLELSVH